MATQPLVAANVRTVDIDPNGDLFVRVLEYDRSVSSTNGVYPVLEEALMKVSRSTLIEHSDTFAKMLGGRFAEASQTTVTIEDHDTAAVELWFRVLHDNITADSFLLHHKVIWEAVKFSQLYFIKVEKMNGWFARYWDETDVLDVDDMRQLLFLCQKFDHHISFALLTKRLAHEASGHITELNPTRHRDLHLQGRIIQQLNSARGSMRGKIIGAILDPLGDIQPGNRFCARNCAGFLEAQNFFLEAVKRTKVWPMTKNHLHSNKDILTGPGFRDWTCKKPENACAPCHVKLAGSVVHKTYSDILSYWEGLCLDCMDFSIGDSDKDYWAHSSSDNWDRGCRLKHKRNTWYFSFMGRPEKMNVFAEKEAERRRQQRGWF